ncbi:MAG: hypothetical protein QG574_5255 [Cyanobacteriota bacterium erpe_2018_sw_21hr_WHONDRS-SW48-000092_B_bin.40]|nr:hypothetical protein [Cyanobacteriota bacterium erpe_2018_sw_21hr_WHONDRS-SW48-000092_B_bin.40]
MDISKTISDFLRLQYFVGASHARELAAAFLGYKSHASYLAATSAAKLSSDQIDVLIPDLACLGNRLQTITSLPPLPNERQLAKEIGDDLKSQKLFSGSVLIAKDQAELKELMHGGYLHDNVSLEDELSGVIAVSNSWFGYESYNQVKVATEKAAIVIHASGVFNGEHDDESERPNHGDIIDFDVTLRLQLTAWGIGFRQTIFANGNLRSHYA